MERTDERLGCDQPNGALGSAEAQRDRRRDGRHSKRCSACHVTAHRTTKLIPCLSQPSPDRARTPNRTPRSSFASRQPRYLMIDDRRGNCSCSKVGKPSAA